MSRYSGNPAMLFAYTVWQRQLPYCIYSGNEWHYAWTFFFFTRCVFSDIIRLNNLIFQFICRFSHLNSNMIKFWIRYFSLKILLKSVKSFLEFGCRYFFDLKKLLIKHSAIRYLMSVVVVPCGLRGVGQAQQAQQAGTALSKGYGTYEETKFHLKKWGRSSC